MKTTGKIAAAVLAITLLSGQAHAYENGEAAKDIIRQGLLGAATGALSAGASGGKAGKGALIGAGTNVIGGALLGFLTGGPSTAPRQTALETPYPQYSQPAYYSQPQTYAQPAPVYAQPTQPVYYYQPQYQPQPVYVQRYTEPQRVVYAQPSYSYSYARPQADSNMRIIRSGLLGAGVGAISAGASGGKAGQGALIGAGSNVIGGALLDILTQ